MVKRDVDKLRDRLLGILAELELAPARADDCGARAATRVHGQPSDKYPAALGYLEASTKSLASDLRLTIAVYFPEKGSPK